MGKCQYKVIQPDNYVVILNFTKRTNELASCVSLYAKERSSQKIQGLLRNRFRLGGRNDGDRKELINKPSPAFVVFANAQTQLLPLLDLLQARRVSPTERCSCRLNLLAIRTCFAPSVRKSALTSREGKRNLNELINLSTYPLINFNKNIWFCILWQI